MILKIIVGLSVVQIIFNFLSYFKIKNLIIRMMEQSSSSSYEQQLDKIEHDLNSRLREIQTAQFSPQFRRPNYVRLVKNQEEDR